MPSTSRGGFFPFVQCSYTFVHLTSVHCPTYNPPPTVCPVVSSWSGPSNPPLDTCIRSRAKEKERERERLAEVRRSELGWLIILLNRKKGSPAIILPAYDVLSIVCHGHCDIRVRWGGAIGVGDRIALLGWRNVLKRRSGSSGEAGGGMLLIPIKVYIAEGRATRILEYNFYDWIGNFQCI